MTCNLCGGENHPERVELGLAWCLKCAQDQPVLSRPEFCLLGQHKGPPLVVSAASLDWQRHESYMRK